MEYSCSLLALSDRSCKTTRQGNPIVMDLQILNLLRCLMNFCFVFINLLVLDKGGRY